MYNLTSAILYHCRIQYFPWRPFRGDYHVSRLEVAFYFKCKSSLDGFKYYLARNYLFLAVNKDDLISNYWLEHNSAFRTVIPMCWLFLLAINMQYFYYNSWHFYKTLNHPLPKNNLGFCEYLPGYVALLLATQIIHVPAVAWPFSVNVLFWCFGDTCCIAAPAMIVIHWWL